MTLSNPAATPDAGVAEDDAPDLDAIHRRHGHWLLAFLRRRFGRENAEDLAQETYLRAARAGDPIRNPRAYLALVATSAARDQARRAAVRPVFAPDDATNATAEADQAERLLLKQIILGLPPALRVVVVLHRFAGLTQPEIAGRLGISLKTVEARMTRAKALCVARLQD